MYEQLLSFLASLEILSAAYCIVSGLWFLSPITIPPLNTTYTVHTHTHTHTHSHIRRAQDNFLTLQRQL